MTRIEKAYISTEDLGAEEITRINAAERYMNQPQEIRDKDLKDLIKYFKSDDVGRRAHALYESGKATTPEVARAIMQEEDFNDRLDSYH